jgi:cation transport ATPase
VSVDGRKTEYFGVGQASNSEETVNSLQQQDRKTALVVSALGGLFAGLCCLTPIVLVSFGLTSVTIANNWGNLLYGEYKWWFRVAGLAMMGITLVLYLRGRGVCTLDQVRRQRNRIVNLVVLSLLGFTAVYVFWVYVVLHEWGIAAGLPWAQWDESWAIPVSAVLMVCLAAAALLLPRLDRGTRSDAGGAGASGQRASSR